jgi:hypothetical protein
MHGSAGGLRGNDVRSAVERRVSSAPLYRNRVRNRRRRSVLRGSADTGLWYRAPPLLEWQDNQQRVDSGFLKDMRVSSKMIEIEREVKLALDTNPGPYYFGTRLDFNYAVFGLRSPEQFPAWWHPGTSFSLSSRRMSFKCGRTIGFKR